MIGNMAGVHRYKTRNFRPNPDEEFEPFKAAVEAEGYAINRVLRAVLRWIVADPKGALRVLRPHLKAVDDDTDPEDVGKRGGRPRKDRGDLARERFEDAP